MARLLWAIGDLHGDALCARYWVRRTGLVRQLEQPAHRWEWADPAARLIFMGDYIDKGPYARQVLQFVKDLTDRFPEKVTALMGNHEANLLLDRSKPAGYRYFEYPYGVAHPMQYLEWLPASEPVSNNSEALRAIFDALLTVYSKGLYRSTAMTPSGRKSIARLVPDSQKDLVATALEHWQESYLDSVRTGSPLGDWMHRLPVTVRAADTLFVHGGLPFSLLHQHLRSREELEALNGEGGSPALRSEEALGGTLHELLEVASPPPSIRNVIFTAKRCAPLGPVVPWATLLMQ